MNMREKLARLGRKVVMGLGLRLNRGRRAVAGLVAMATMPITGGMAGMAGVAQAQPVMPCITIEQIGEIDPFPGQFQLQPHDLEVGGDYAYLACGGSGLRIVDVSDPKNPTEVSLWNEFGQSRDVVLNAAGTIAYVADSGDGLQIVDMSNPAAPTLLAELNTGLASGVTVVDDVVYVAIYSNLLNGRAGSLSIVNVSDPAAPTIIADYPFYVHNSIAVYNGIAVEVVGDYAYVTTAHPNTLQIIDISDPANPDPDRSEFRLGNSTDWWSGLTVIGTTAYLPSGSAGIYILDVSDPMNPVLLNRIEESISFGTGVVVIGTTAYVSSWDRVIQVFDVTEPKAPMLRVDIPESSRLSAATALEVVGTTAFVAYHGAGGSRLRIFDINESTTGCAADCDVSTGTCVLDIFDFLCFQNRFVQGDLYACDCDTSTGAGVCDVLDFVCFQDAFVAGCP